ncbi:MAG TPA: helix-turn-helix domain-containing protein [Acidimicrobiales bacterium]|nr:helix-turn-helix domain-containing protein [Acidimicrobiales bacterium]
MTWDLRLDYQRIDADGLTHGNVRNGVSGVELSPGRFVIVGNEDADPAVAEIVRVEGRAVVLVRVLLGSVGDQLHLRAHDWASTTTSADSSTRCFRVAFCPSCAHFLGDPTLENHLDKLAYTVTEVAELLGISRTRAYECVRRGEIPSLRLGRRLLVTRAGLEQLLELHSVVVVDRT